VKARHIVREIFEHYMQAPQCLPDDWRGRAETADGPAQQTRLIADYTAGMTDRYAFAEHSKLFDPYART